MSIGYNADAHCINKKINNMAAITSNTESWNGHKFSEVESHIKGNYIKTSDSEQMITSTITTMAGGLLIYTENKTIPIQ